MTTVFVLMVATNISITMNHSMLREMPYKAYTNYDQCRKAAEFYSTDEKLTGISYYCIEMEVK